MSDAASTMFPDQAGDQAPTPAPAPRQPRQPMSLALNSDQRYARQTRSLADGHNSLSGDDDVADTYYDATPEPAAAPQAAPQPQQAAPARIDPLQVPPEVAAARKANATIEDTMYASTPVDLGESAHGPLRYDNPMASDAELAAYAAETGNVLTKDFLASTDDAKQILNIAMEHRTAPPDERQVGEMRRLAWQQVQAKYGRGAQQVLNDAQTLIKRDPRVVRALDAFNLGDNPRVVMAACESAVRARAQGKFPTGRARR